MLDIIAEIKAEAHRELTLAQAKIEVAEAIERKYLAKQTELDSEIDVVEDTVDEEQTESEFNAI